MSKEIRGKDNLRLSILQEFIWWIIAAVISIGVLIPLITQITYLHLYVNMLIIFIAVIYFRYSFFYYDLPWLRPAWVRFLISLISINLIVFNIRQAQYFISIYDAFTIEDLGTPHHPLSPMKIASLYRYFYYETIISIISSIILILLFLARTILYYWKNARRKLETNLQ